jgi:hypothetical protein
LEAVSLYFEDIIAGYVYEISSSVFKFKILEAFSTMSSFLRYLCALAVRIPSFNIARAGIVMCQAHITNLIANFHPLVTRGWDGREPATGPVYDACNDACWKSPGVILGEMCKIW